MFKLSVAIREKWREGYQLSDLRADLLAGMVVALVAIPLGMALAIASGVSPQCGLYTVIIGGGIVAALGGSRCQVTGPTAAFVVILVPIVDRFGLGGLLMAGMIAGVFLVIMGSFRLGQLIQYIPHPVTTGFTSGIGLVIATIQLKDFFGLKVEHLPENYIGRVLALLRAHSSWSPVEFLIGVSTLALLLIWPKLNRRIPAPLVALSVVSVLAAILETLSPGLQVSTIGTRFHGIPQSLPHIDWPWHFTGIDGRPFLLSFDSFQALIPSAFAIAMLGAIESLLSAVVSDAMAQTKHDPDAELLALGVGNILCPFFGGIAATGAIARTATNIRYGARSPIASMSHAVYVLLAILLFAPLISYLPMAGLAALLILVAYNMSDVKHFVHIVKVAPKEDVAVLLLCFGFTVIFDMVVGVTVGIVFAALLFMRRMAKVTVARPASIPEHHLKIPKEWVVYEIAGPLFFGAAEKAVGAIGSITDVVKTVVFVMDQVPVMDVTGMVSFETAVGKLLSHHCQIILVNVQPQPLSLLKKSSIFQETRDVRFCTSIQEALR